MRAFWPAPSRLASERVADFSVGDVASVLGAIGLASEQTEEISSHWREAQTSEEWSSLLASGLTMVDRDRGNIDQPLPIWPDLDGEGDVGRLFYFYLGALCYDATVSFLRENATPENVIGSTMNIYRLHAATHLRKQGTLGFDAGWWSLLVLRGELLAIGSLQFHRVNMGVGTLPPSGTTATIPTPRFPGFAAATHRWAFTSPKEPI